MCLVRSKIKTYYVANYTIEAPQLLENFGVSQKMMRVEDDKFSALPLLLKWFNGKRDK